MNNINSFRILVEHERKHGYDVFTSPDVNALYIASTNIKTAFKAIVPNLRVIFAHELNTNIDDIKIKSDFSFSRFKKMLEDSKAGSPQLLYVKLQ